MDYNFFAQVAAAVMAFLGAWITIAPPSTKRQKWLLACAFIALLAAVLVCLYLQSKDNRLLQQRANDARELAERRQHELALGVENMKGQLGALSVVLGKFVESGRDGELNKVASAIQQVLRNASVSPSTKVAIPIPTSTDPRYVSVDIPPAGTKPEAFIGQQRVEASIKPPDTVYVSVIVSDLTRAKGIPDESVIRSVVSALQKTPGVLVFFVNSGYSLKKGSSVRRFSGGLSARSERGGSIFYFDEKNEAAAQRVMDVVKSVTEVRNPQYSRVYAAEDAAGVMYQEFWKTSGIDIEVVL